MLDPDINQIEIFTDAVFRRAGDGFVSLRAFFEKDSPKPYKIAPVSMSGTSLSLLNERAFQVAREAANHPTSVVFCPPIAVFRDRNGAREADLKEGLALSVECDQRPDEALATLSRVIGRPTVVVTSGGTWINPQTGEIEDKLHLHWRLSRPASGAGLKDLKEARDLATRLVGGDLSNKTIVHPIRWPGSWHRKGEPVMCAIDNELLNADIEIDLGDALAKLRAAAPKTNGKASGSINYSGFVGEHDDLIAKILAGTELHDSIARLSAKMVTAGMTGGAVVNLLRSLMKGSAAPKDGRWQDRYDDIPRAVATAEAKFRRPDDGPPASSDKPKSSKSKAEVHTVGQFLDAYETPIYLVDRLMQRGYFYSLTGNTGSGKSAIGLHLSFCIVLGIPFGPYEVKKGRVLYIAKENATDIRQRMFGMIEAYRIDIGATDRDFLVVEVLGDLEKDLPVIAAAVEKFGPVDLVCIDTSAATFTGEEENSNTQILAHALKQRAYCTLPGKPTTLTFCHPVKNAVAQENLIPRGGGAFLNEVDGNFTAYPYGEKLADFHWAGKLRGPDFDKITFRFATVYPEKLRMADGRLFPTVMAEIATEEQLAEAEEKAEFQDERMLSAIAKNPGSSTAKLAAACEWIGKADGKPLKSLVHRVLSRLVKASLVSKEGEGQATRYTLTKRGQERANRSTKNSTGTV